MKKKLLLSVLAIIMLATTSRGQKSGSQWLSVVKQPSDNELLYGSGIDFMYSVPICYYFPAAPGQFVFLEENAEDFDVMVGDNWVIENLALVISISPNLMGIQYFDVRFYEDVYNGDGLSRPEIAPFNTQRIFTPMYYQMGPYDYIVLVPLNNPVTVNGGNTYWISFAAESYPAMPGYVHWYHSSSPDYPGSPAAFTARNTPVETTWSYGPTYYGGNNPPDLTLAIYGSHLGIQVVPLAGWMIPLIFGVIVFVTFLRFRRG